MTAVNCVLCSGSQLVRSRDLGCGDLTSVCRSVSAFAELSTLKQCSEMSALEMTTRHGVAQGALIHNTY